MSQIIVNGECKEAEVYAGLLFAHVQENPTSGRKLCVEGLYHVLAALTCSVQIRSEGKRIGHSRTTSNKRPSNYLLSSLDYAYGGVGLRAEAISGIQTDSTNNKTPASASHPYLCKLPAAPNGHIEKVDEPEQERIARYPKLL